MLLSQKRNMVRTFLLNSQKKGNNRLGNFSVTRKRHWGLWPRSELRSDGKHSGRTPQRKSHISWKGPPGIPQPTKSYENLPQPTKTYHSLPTATKSYYKEEEEDKEEVKVKVKVNVEEKDKDKVKVKVKVIFIEEEEKEIMR